MARHTRIYSRWSKPPKYYKEFAAQRFNAERRCIPFKLSFDEWLAIWKRSRHLPHRGKGDGKYCMARFGDKGAYEVGNVRIITHNQNSEEIVVTPAMRKARAVNKGKTFSVQHRIRIGAALKGRVFSEETRRKMSIAAKNRRR